MELKLLEEIAFINPDSIKKDYPYHEIEYIDISSVGTGYLIEAKPMLLSEASSRAKRLVKDGDTILSTVRPNRRSFLYVKAPESNIVVSTGFAVLRAKDGVDPRYLYYSITDQKFTDYLTLSAKGAAYPAVDTEIIQRGNIPFHPLDIQKKISLILSAYDELVENNLRRIKILEEMAQNFYREWFVKFRFPGYQNTRFVDSSLSCIPEGWKVPFSDHVDFKEGPGLRNWQYKDHGIPFLNIRTLVNNDVDFSKVNYLDEIEVESKYQHFLLKEFDHVVSSSGTLGRLVTIRSEHLPLLLNTSIIRMRPIGLSIGCWQLKHFLLSDYFQNQARSFATGSAQANFGPSHLNQMFIVAPPKEINSLYEDIVDPIEMAIMCFARRNNILRQTRDLLLPKLISGEVDVSDLDINLPEEVAS